jgi:uncharacterized membrane protein
MQRTTDSSPSALRISQAATLARLALISLMPLALYLARLAYTGHLAFRFLPVNLLLAWPSMLFASAALRFGRRRWAASLPFMAGWLAFLPNAPYLVTDLIWLDGPASALKVYDTLLFFAFATCGLGLGFVSLHWMQALMTQRFGVWPGRAFVGLTLGLTGFGLYLGRFRRWNSWDVLADPLALLQDIAVRIANPIEHWRTWVLTIAFTVFLLFLYWLAATLAHENRLKMSVERTGVL